MECGLAGWFARVAPLDSGKWCIVGGAAANGALGVGGVDAGAVLDAGGALGTGASGAGGRAA